MGNKNTKTVAIVLIVLLFGYYQKWVFFFIYEFTSSDERLIQRPQIPFVYSGQNYVDHAIEDIKIRLESENGKSKSDFLPSVDSDSPNPYFDKEPQSEVLSAVVQYQLNVLQSYTCQPSTLSCGAPVADRRIQFYCTFIFVIINDGYRRATVKGGGNSINKFGFEAAISDSFNFNFPDCGLGCQVHHLMTCLMISFSLNATLIPDFSYWPYSIKWDDIFEPINPLNCQPDNVTTSVVWYKDEIGLNHGDTTRKLKIGLPITRDLSRKLKITFSNPFLWWAGQFANFTLQLQPFQAKWIEKTKQLLEFSTAPVVGILLRRRDKKGEKRKPFHSIDKHFNAAKAFFEDLEVQRPNIFNSTRRVYIATDDMSVLKLARKRYRPPKWEIFGAQRKSEAEDIVKDIYLLSACNYIVCNFSSDICRLVAELMDPKKLNVAQKVKSLNTKYSYQGKEVNKLKFIFPYLFPKNVYFIETYSMCIYIHIINCPYIYNYAYTATA